MSTLDISKQFSLDVNGLNALKLQAHNSSPEALKATAQQFEALLLQVVLKSMRDATPHDGMFDSEQTRMYESLLDQQLAQVLSSKGGGTGLATMIEKQLARTNQDPVPLGNLPLSPPPGPTFPLPTLPSSSLPVSPTSAASTGAESVPPASREFISRVWPHAYSASRATGIPAHFMVAQAALETGWGKSEPRLADGRPSYNLFGIKAGKSWNGPVVEAASSEYVDGVMEKQVGRFRAYGSYAEAFNDYAKLLLSNPRYAGVVGSKDAGTFARGLQQAGYATDPLYASKLTRIIAGNTLRQSLAS